MNFPGGPPLDRLANVVNVPQFLLTLVGPGDRAVTGAVILFDGGLAAK